MATATKKKTSAKKPTTKKSPARKAPARTSGVSVNTQPDQPTLLIAIWLILILVFLVLVITKR
jgi:hypothetical protein